MVGVPEVVRLPSDVNLGADVGLVTARLPRLAVVVIGRAFFPTRTKVVLR